jgi:hypothetical protein
MTKLFYDESLMLLSDLILAERLIPEWRNCMLLNASADSETSSKINIGFE